MIFDNVLNAKQGFTVKLKHGISITMNGIEFMSILVLKS
ncbi:hypothetical protein EJK55_1710 [Moraxella catarrhalis]|uniref:Uncharacterized protein n=1 Tax=Moraxella catarrhalis TaxID=480 RepID=A0ABY0BL77_MORCA|nr:hypothetical protein MCR_1840 [Moraxella catarrhalis BBH18]AZQ88593.1 hypothetical protein EJK50_1987 [Moraxella catarrhalis]EGE15355.1 hypothetical protein E9K_03586 [Moraxella catarrhalis 103P14B1]EGE24575.1 hypothetical protein E9Y_04780 [Moraxella catarrhalis 101P30B1]AZQ91934.1 hypothetical protein EJK51_1891 [Moraxella catarrhalis]